MKWAGFFFKREVGVIEQKLNSLSSQGVSLIVKCDKSGAIIKNAKYSTGSLSCLSLELNTAQFLCPQGTKTFVVKTPSGNKMPTIQQRICLLYGEGIKKLPLQSYLRQNLSPRLSIWRREILTNEQLREIFI